MEKEQLIAQLLAQILETDCDIEVACADYPELIPEVTDRLRQVRQVEQLVDKLFPSSDDVRSRSHPFPEESLPSITGYEIESVLGCGGMGVVYKARQQSLDRVVALKMLRAGQFASASDLSRFSRECQTIAKLHCPHIIQIHDVGEVDGQPFFTMEYVEGGSLADLLHGTPQPAIEAAKLVATIAEAIDSAHSRGIIHRDLKPSNILLTREMCPKVVDFGLARQIECDQPITLSGVQLGTPSYMAPEVALSRKDAIGPAVDIYSLGAVLYEMLTGRPPFRAETPLETMRQTACNEPVTPSLINASVPRDLETICLKCLDKQPLRRYTSAGDLAADLTRFLNHEPIQARPTGRVERVLRWSLRNPATTALTITALALVCLAVAFGLREYGLAKQRLAEAESWTQTLEYVTRLERESRFLEARSMLARMPMGSSQALRRQITTAQAELNLAEKLQAIRMNRGKFVIGGGIDYDESSRQYASAFAGAAIGSPQHKPQGVADRIKSMAISAALVEALDDWAICATADLRAWILEVARRSDPDPWRDAVRNQGQWASLEHLKQLAEAVEIDRQPVTTMVAMGTRWRRLGGDPTPFLKRVHQHYPNDFWCNFELALIMHASSPIDSLAYNLAALAVRPDAASVNFNLAGAYQQLDRREEAMFYFQRVLEIDPQHSWAEHQLAIELFNAGRRDDALIHFRKALEIEPTFKDTANGLRIALVQMERLDEAAAVWLLMLDNAACVHQDIDGLAELCLYLNRKDDYERTCRAMLERFGNTQDPLVCERIGRACLLSPSTEAITREAIALVDRALATKLPYSQAWAEPYLLIAKALSEYRQARYQSAVNILERVPPEILPPAPDLVRAMALTKLDNLAEARTALTHADDVLKQVKPPGSREAWLYEILRREAAGLIDRRT